jgi:chloride channel 7
VRVPKSFTLERACILPALQTSIPTLLFPAFLPAAVRVPESFTLERAYILFSTMGLRHLVVVDEHNRVRGMVTRKDLLGYKLDEAVKRSRSGGPLASQGTLESPVATPHVSFVPDATPDRF